MKMLFYAICVYLLYVFSPSVFCTLPMEIKPNYVKWRNDVINVVTQVTSEEEATTGLTTLLLEYYDNSDVIPVTKTNAIIVASEDHIYQYREFTYSNIAYFINSRKDVRTVMTSLNNHINSTKWNPNIKIIIVLTYRIPQEVELEVTGWISDFFMLSWNFQYLNTAVIYWAASDVKLKVFTYNPFLRLVQDKSNCLKNTKIFDNKLTNLYGYPFRVVQIPYVPRTFNIKINGKLTLAGLDNKIILTLIHHLNATAKMEYDHNMSLYTIQKITQDLAMNVSDIFFNLVPAFSSFGPSFLYPFVRDDICVLVPNSDKIPVYLTMFYPFSIFGWSVIFFSIIGIKIVWYFLKRNDFVLHHRSNDYDLVLNFWKLVLPLLNLCPGYSFHHSSNKEKLLLILWMSYCFYVCTSYQSVLFSFLTVPRYYEELNSIEDIERSGIKVMAYERDIHFLKRFGEIDQAFVARLHGHDFFYGTLENRSMGYLLRTLMGEYYISQHDRMGIDIKYRFAKDCIFPSISTYYINPRLAFSNRLNSLLAEIFQSGIPTKLTNDALHEFYMSTNIYKQKSDEADRSQDLSDLYFAFYFLFGGYAISSIVFIIECLSDLELQRLTIRSNIT